MKVLVTAPFDEALLNRLTAVSRDIKLEQRTLPERQWPDDWTTDAAVYYAISAVPRPEQAPNLRWIQTHWAGVDHLRPHPIWDSDILITTASGVHAPNMAQYVMAQILSWANHVPRWLQTKQEGRWPSRRWEKFVPDELRGRTVGILGYGSVGREVARLAKAFGMKVLATKRDARQPAHGGYTLASTGDPDGNLVDRLYPGEATRSMVANCDYVVVTLPATETTRHLISEEMLREMKPTAYLINVGRGSVVDEAALVRALRRGWIAGAGLDVFAEEPLPDDSPLWTLENVILTPHISGFTPHYDERVVALFAENLRRYLDDQTLLNRVDRERGY